MTKPTKPTDGTCEIVSWSQFMDEIAALMGTSVPIPPELRNLGQKKKKSPPSRSRHNP